MLAPVIRPWKHYTSEIILSNSLPRQSKVLHWASAILCVHYFKKRNDSNTVTYRASNSPISDISFLSKAARDKCQGISTYWMYRSCETPICKNSSQANLFITKKVFTVVNVVRQLGRPVQCAKQDAYISASCSKYWAAKKRKLIKHIIRKIGDIYNFCWNMEKLIKNGYEEDIQYASLTREDRRPCS